MSGWEVHKAPGAVLLDRRREFVTPLADRSADSAPIVAMQTFSEVAVRLGQLIDRLTVTDQDHLTGVVQRMLAEEGP